MGRATALLLIALAALPAWPTGAQTTGDCGLGEATALLDVANVRARLFNNGGLFWRGGSPLYEVPKGSGVTPIFLTNLWVGGLVEGEVRMSGSNYGSREMWPGPLDEEANPPDDCSVYDRLFSVYDEDIRRYNQTGEATADMQDWPWHLGAPVFDGDGDPDNYNLAGGDRPHVFGDQTVWWVMNDAGNRHRTTDTGPMGLEVRASAFAATDVGLWSPHTTFYRYELVNRLPVPIDSVYLSMYSEGDPDGFFVGSDSVAGMSYLYKAYDYDRYGYGDRPPAIGFTFVQGPLVNDDGEDNDRDGTIDEDDERLRMTSFLRHNHNFGINGWPHNSIGWYRFLQGLWNDGSPMTVGGCCGVWHSTTPTRFMFSGRPPNFWSEENIDGLGHRNPAWFNVLFTSTGPFRIEPGETQEIVFAIVYSQGNDRLDSVYRLLGAPASLRNALPYLMAFDTTSVVAPQPEAPTPAHRPDYHLSHYPEPASDAVFFDFELPTGMPIRLAVYDILGREVLIVEDRLFGEGRNRVSSSVAGLPPGLYICRLETSVETLVRPVTVVRP